MINILPYNQKKMIDRLRMLRAAAVTLWAVIFLVGTAILLLIPLLVTINSRFAITGKQIDLLERSGVVVNPVDVAALQTRATVLKEKLAMKLKPSPWEYVSIIRSSVTPGIILSGYSIEQGDVPSIEIAGTTATREGLQKFIATLEKDARVAEVESPVSNYVKSTNSPFSVTVVFKEL